MRFSIRRGSGLFADELRPAIANPSNYDYDARRVRRMGRMARSPAEQSAAADLYVAFNRTRSGDTVAAKLRGWTDAESPGKPAKLIAQAAAAPGSIVLLGEKDAQRDQHRSGAHAGAVVRRSEDSFRLGDRVGDRGERCRDAEHGGAWPSSNVARSGRRGRRRYRCCKDPGVLHSQHVDGRRERSARKLLVHLDQSEQLVDGGSELPRRDDQWRSRSTRCRDQLRKERNRDWNGCLPRTSTTRSRRRCRLRGMPRRS